jgi:hypothetical protein
MRSRRARRTGNTPRARPASAGRAQRAASQALEDQQRAATELTRIESEYGDENRRIEGLEADVEAARSEVFSALNVATYAAARNSTR